MLPQAQAAQKPALEHQQGMAWYVQSPTSSHEGYASEQMLARDGAQIRQLSSVPAGHSHQHHAPWQGVNSDHIVHYQPAQPSLYSGANPNSYEAAAPHRLHSGYASSQLSDNSSMHQSHSEGRYYSPAVTDRSPSPYLAANSDPPHILCLAMELRRAQIQHQMQQLDAAQQQLQSEKHRLEQSHQAGVHQQQHHAHIDQHTLFTQQYGQYGAQHTSSPASYRYVQQETPTQMSMHDHDAQDRHFTHHLHQQHMHQSNSPVGQYMQSSLRSTQGYRPQQLDPNAAPYDRQQQHEHTQRGHDTAVQQRWPEQLPQQLQVQDLTAQSNPRTHVPQYQQPADIKPQQSIENPSGSQYHHVPRSLNAQSKPSQQRQKGAAAQSRAAAHVPARQQHHEQIAQLLTSPEGAATGSGHHSGWESEGVTADNMHGSDAYDQLPGRRRQLGEVNHRSQQQPLCASHSMNGPTLLCEQALRAASEGVMSE